MSLFQPHIGCFIMFIVMAVMFVQDSYDRKKKPASTEYDEQLRDYWTAIPEQDKDEIVETEIYFFKKYGFRTFE